MYSHWDSRAQTVSKLKWYKLTDLINYCHGVRDYVIGSTAKLSLSYMPKLQPQEPFFGQHQRFPENDIYLTEGVGEWNIRIDRLALILSTLFSTNKIERKYPDITTQGEAELVVLSCIDDLLKAIEIHSDVFDQFEFENRYELVWQVFSE
ncbi:hypothetical protein CLU79DRAFT_786979 [Phycomyces nitens]|nr:hypothetical protein CLU79DRAFT_786979 [Phycomyces nitens]